MDAIRICLNEVDLDTATKKQGMSSFLWILFVFVCFEALRVGEGRWTIKGTVLMCVWPMAVRALVEQRLQTELVGERRAFLDRCIDDELEVM